MWTRGKGEKRSETSEKMGKLKVPNDVDSVLQAENRALNADRRLIAV
jgi:hypothetical protein